MAYEHQEFPKWKYHPSAAARVVNDPAEEDGLGADWQDSPLFERVDEPEADTKPEPITKRRR